MRSLFDEPPPPPKDRVSALTLSISSEVIVRVDVNTHLLELDGRVTDVRHSSHIVVAVGGTILAFTPDGKRCLTDGFGPQTTILSNRS